VSIGKIKRLHKIEPFVRLFASTSEIEIYGYESPSHFILRRA